MPEISNTTPSLPQNTLDVLHAKLKVLLVSYQESPTDTTVVSELEKLSIEIAQIVATMSSRDKEGSLVQVAIDIYKDLSLSGFYDRVVPSSLQDIAQNHLKNNWPGLLAAMLLVPAFQLSQAPKIEETPMWLWPIYVAYLFYTPQGYCGVGQADAYAAQYKKRIPELLRLAEANRGSASVRSALSFYLSTGNCIPIYFCHDPLRDLYLQRARILSIGFGAGHQDELLAFSREGRRLRIGFINRHFSPQTETYTTIPSFEHLDPERFEVILFALHQSDTPLESFVRGCVSEFRILPDDLNAQVQAIRDTMLDVAVFGTNLTAVCNEVTKLALFRMAPLQVVNNSSCTTSGMAEVDLYVSGTLTESEEAPSHFSERLGLLPGPAHAFNYEADKQEPSIEASKEQMGIPTDALLFVSAANFYKITPEMMHVWAKLLVLVPGSHLLLHPFNPNWSSSYPIKRFCAVFDAVLDAHGVAHDRLSISSLKFPSRTDVKVLMSIGDIYLDTFPFGGVNSLIDPLETGVPCVVWDGLTFRSRMGGALLRSLGLERCVAQSEAQYLEIVSNLARDQSLRTEIKQHILAAMERTPLFLDTLAASDAFGALVETAFDEMVTSGKKAFRKNSTPIKALLSEDAASLLAQGWDSLALAEVEKAKSIAWKLLGAQPNSPQARHLMARCLLQSGANERATLYLSSAVQQAEGSAQIWTDLALSFYRVANLQQAVQSLNVALGLDQTNIDALVLMARIARECGELEGYQEMIAAAERLAPDDPRVLDLINSPSF